MYAILIILVGIGTAYLANRLSRRQTLRLADLLIGIVSGLVGISVAQYIGMADVGWSLSLPLLVACALTLGLSHMRTAHA
jgi:hypothetical protein